MSWEQSLDFAIRNRDVLVALAAIVFFCTGMYLIVRLVEHARGKISEYIEEEYVPIELGIFIGLSLDQSVVDSVRHRVVKLVAVLLHFHRKWVYLLASILTIIGIGGGVWFFDQHQARLITAGLNFPHPVCERSQRQGVIIFVHGWTGDVKQTWKQFPTLMCGDDRYRSFDIVSVGYPTFMVKRSLSVSETANWMLESINERIKLSGREKIIFVAHSLGGLIAREITILQRLQQQPGQPEHGQIILLVEIASPHYGASIAKLAAALGVSKDLASDMQENSNSLRKLHVHWNKLLQRPKTLCFSSPGDSIVPIVSAFYQCDQQERLPTWGHIELVKPESREDPRYSVPTRELWDTLQGSL